MMCYRWPSRAQVRRNLPKSFQHFKKTIAVLDCTEYKTQRPSNPSTQRVTYSKYKHGNTFKQLICISPNGMFTFLSKLWSGSVSDREITRQSGFLEYILPGDDVMADRGFLIRDLLVRRGGTLNIPPFSHGKQLTAAATTKTRRIASARIHVERAIGRLKQFKLLDQTLALKTKSHYDNIIRVCAALCNLDKPLVK